MGGIQRNGRGLARTLLRAGSEVMVLSSVLNVGSGGTVEPGENDDLLQGGAKIVYLRELNSLWARLRELYNLVTEVRRFRPDVLIGTGTSWHLGLLGMMLPSKVQKIFYEGMSGESNGLKDPRWLVRWFFDEVVGQSPRVAETFAQSFGWRKRLHNIPAFPEPLELTAHLPTASRRPVPFGAARAGFFSRLVEGKQGLWLVRQWHNLKDMLDVLHIHGRGPEFEAIKSFIEANALGDRVQCFGAYPSGQSYADLLATYDLTLLPTIFPEGAPLVLLESMACGVPFVANGVGGIPDYAIGNPNCVVVSDKSKFLVGVKQMTLALKEGKIDQPQLQRLYLLEYSQDALEKKWLSYLGIQSS